MAGNYFRLFVIDILNTIFFLLNRRNRKLLLNLKVKETKITKLSYENIFILFFYLSKY
jgi:hypothetical protein